MTKQVKVNYIPKWPAVSSAVKISEAVANKSNQDLQLSDFLMKQKFPHTAIGTK